MLKWTRETSNKALTAINELQLVPFLMSFLAARDKIPIGPVTAAAQCLYVLTSCQTGDVAQGNIERLTGALKYNWLGRGRTGRDRRGWVGIKSGQRVGLVGAA